MEYNEYLNINSEKKPSFSRTTNWKISILYTIAGYILLMALIELTI